MYQIIDGKKISQEIKNKIKEEIQEKNLKICLAVILVGENKASKIYVKNKNKACEECGIESKIILLDENITEEELIKNIEALNNDKNITGILVQLPLPKQINEENIVNIIDPKKDVDCFHPYNVGKFYNAKNYNNLLLPCTPKGCLTLIKSTNIVLAGKKAVIIGRSNIVGKPIAQMLLNENCTVTILHSKSQNFEKEIKTADLLIVAIGKAKFIKKEYLKENVIIIDVGINRLEDGTVCGDVDFEDVKEKCSFITPVPKGVGPMTIASLLENTLLASKL